MNRTHNFPGVKWSMAVFSAILLLAGSVLASVAREHVIYDFQGNDNGEVPYGGVISDKAGNFYGTTVESSGGGTVFELSPNGTTWTQTVLYEFTGGSDGGFPVGELVFDQAGNLYGVTQAGGSMGGGVVFQLTPQGGTWAESVIYNFTASEGPVGGLVFDSAGNLYGATDKGGEKQSGSVFQLAPAQGSWTQSVICSFGIGRNALDGPSAGPVISKAGDLFGVATNGGNGVGGVYEVRPPKTQGGAWTEHTLYAFQKGNDAAEPLGRLAIDHQGNLYGVSAAGGTGTEGTVFELSRNGNTWSDAVLYSFCAETHCDDGAVPMGGVIIDGKTGNVYGTTFYGGDGNVGVVFQLTPPANQGGAWTESTLHSFKRKGGDGASPRGRLAFGKFGSLMGTTTVGGSGLGTVFSVLP